MVKHFGTQEEDVVLCEYNRLGPTNKAKILTTKIIKKYKVVNNKSLVANDFTCYPYGYK